MKTWCATFGCNLQCPPFLGPPRRYCVHSTALLFPQVETLSNKVAESKCSTEAISVVRYSPDGTKMAAGSHDQLIYVFDVTRGWGGLCCGMQLLCWAMQSDVM